MWEPMIQRHLDGIAGSEEVACLSEQLESDPELRKLYLQMARIHATLASEYFEGLSAEGTATTSESRAVVSFSGKTSRAGVGPSGREWLGLFAVTAVVLLVVFGTFYLLSGTKPKGKPEIMMITELEGHVRWTGDSGEVSDDLESDAHLTGGTLELLSPDSSIVLRFADDSTVAISGLSFLTVSDLDQKQLHLRWGNLSTNVKPQPKDKPLLVHTPAAELKVLGAQFDVTADLATTKITVSDGRVRVKRVTDGSIVEVPAANQTFVSIGAKERLSVRPVRKATHSWKANLKLDHHYGEWVSAAVEFRRRARRLIQAGKMTREQAAERWMAANFRDDEGSVYAKPIRFGRPKPGENPTVAYIVSVDISESATGPVVFVKGNKFRIKGKLDQPAVVQFGITTSDMQTGASARHVTQKRLPRGEFDVEFSADELQGGRRGGRVGPSPLGRKVTKWWCFTHSEEAKLAITALDLLESKEK